MKRDGIYRATTCFGRCCQFSSRERVSSGSKNRSVGLKATRRIDRSFVARANRGIPSAAIVRVVIELVRVRDITVMAEGAETQPQFDFLALECCTGCRDI